MLQSVEWPVLPAFEVKTACTVFAIDVTSLGNKFWL